MRTLKFIVDGLVIKQDPNCDFSGLVPGSDGYLEAAFTFSPEWNGCAKGAGFFSFLGTEYEPKLLKNDRCVIPAEALSKRKFKIQIIGQAKDGSKTLTTNKVTVSQNGGKG